jgi:fructose-1,6-bisphosphatase I
VIGNDIFINVMRGCGKVKILVSEEEEEAIIFPGNGKYAVVCDPIDGSSNLDAGVSVGTIFGVFRLDEECEGKPEDVCKPGTELVASGFTMYGASANLVLTMKGGGVNGFTLDNSLGEFILTHPNVCTEADRPELVCKLLLAYCRRRAVVVDADTQASLDIFSQRRKHHLLG